MKESSRREFLQQSAVFTAGACCLGITGVLSSCASTRGIAVSENADSASIPVTAFAGQSYVVVKTKKYPEPLYIKKDDSVGYKAYRLYCSHKGCTVNVGTEKLVCPCHGSEFTLDGMVTKGPARESLPVLPVSISGDQLTISFN